MGDAEHEIYGSDPCSLADLMGLAQDSGGEPEPQVLAAVLDEELTKPIQPELSGTHVAGATKAGGPSVESIGDLLRHPHPPLELLLLAKAYARANLQHPDSALPRDVALVLYFTCIAAAMVKCGQRITHLQSRSLRDGLAWAADRTWASDGTRGLLRAALESIQEDKGL